MANLKIVPDVFFYHEQQASYLNGIDARDMWLAGRKTDAVAARYFSIWFMVGYEKKSLGAAGGRYGLDHATAIHALKYIEKNKERKDLFSKKYDDRFQEFKSMVVENNIKRAQNSYSKKVSEEITEKGFDNFINEIAMGLDDFSLELRKYLRDGDVPLELDINIKASDCIEKIEKIKHLFGHDS